MNSTTSPPFPPQPPAQVDHFSLSDSSFLLPVISFFVFLIIVVLIRVFFFVIKCPTTLPDSLRRRPGLVAGNSTSTQLRTNRNNVDQLVSSVVYKEAADVGKDSGGGGSECPVCLTAFVDGEVIREVKICKHLFHDSCIEMWLCSHPNCPVCRVSVGPKRSKRPVVVGGGDEDFRQGSPDSGSLV
ncbi:hypothetical protein Vadar_000155 [Vaccinium darrowii]|uniref:Uncharacterized protein n=1 Tax=Vaccinium darrowii TaxID=229202 RepID=A0ACB7ZGA9_9ERIC|nr:hypothetical protein Vadar_000155 [Vaccinium darrowii]